MMRRFAVLPLVAANAVFCIGALGAESTQTITVTSELKIPEGTLAPGQYTFSVEDHLQDRTIVRIVNSADGSHHLVLTVPDPRIKEGNSGSLISYHAAADASEKSVRAWACPGCAAPLAFVYPKAEAAKITGEAGEAVMAVDPSYDKLPANLSPDDMKMVTLWLLTPKEVTADHKGEGVDGVKLADAPQADAHPANAQPANAQPANAQPANAQQGTAEMAAAPAASPKRHLPKTAGDTYEWALAGIGLLFAGTMMRRMGARKQG